MIEQKHQLQHSNVNANINVHFEMSDSLMIYAFSYARQVYFICSEKNPDFLGLNVAIIAYKATPLWISMAFVISLSIRIRYLLGFFHTRRLKLSWYDGRTQ